MRARTPFATHYHELTELALVRPGVKNRTMAVKEWKGEVVFRRKVVDGVADRSYGVQVAKLAGIPAALLVLASDRRRYAVEDDMAPVHRPPYPQLPPVIIVQPQAQAPQPPATYNRQLPHQVRHHPSQVQFFLQLKK